MYRITPAEKLLRKYLLPNSRIPLKRRKFFCPCVSMPVTEFPESTPNSTPINWR